MHCMQVSFSESRNQQPQLSQTTLQISGHRFSLDESLPFTDGFADVSARSVADAATKFDQLTNRQCKPQLAALVFTATNNPRALDWYFPITNMLSEPEIESFYQLVKSIAENPKLDIQLAGENKTVITDQLPISVRYLIAGQIAEVFFYRQDILSRFFHTPRHFQLYATQQAFEQDKGVKGGDYNPTRQCIQLVVSRLFEGFSGATPGACPFLHELGHMLDHFDASSGSMGKIEGLYPGLSPDDGDVYTPKAREAFIKGKRLERDRYLARQNGDLSLPLPIGHPYVFQNDGEFVAGYLEMFFRNPNYFAAQNSDLYSAYTELFGYDPRKAWKEDFPAYVKANRGFYDSGQKPSPTRLTIPPEAGAEGGTTNTNWLSVFLDRLRNLFRSK